MFRKREMKLIVLIVCLLLHMPLAVGAQEKAGVRPQAMPTTAAPVKANVQPVTVGKAIDPAIKNFWRVNITNFEIGTEADGRWFWRATVENTGNGAVEARRLKLKTTQIKWGPANNPPVPGSVQLITQPIPAHSSVNVKTYWQRCCLTNELAVELVDVTNNHVLGQTSLPGLIHSVPGVIFDAKVSRIEWDDTTKKWRATLSNNSPYALKMVVQGVMITSNTSKPVPVGGQRIVLPPHQSVQSMQLSAPNAVNGDKIKVSLYFDQQSPCTDSARDCGAERGNIMTVPNSRDF